MIFCKNCTHCKDSSTYRYALKRIHGYNSDIYCSINPERMITPYGFACSKNIKVIKELQIGCYDSNIHTTIYVDECCIKNKNNKCTDFNPTLLYKLKSFINTIISYLK